MKQVYADFNSFSADGTLPLIGKGSVESIEALPESLVDGEEVWITDGELRARARVYWCPRADCFAPGFWEARAVWAFESVN